MKIRPGAGQRQGVAAVVAVVALAAGGTSPLAHQEPQQPVFTSGTELVEVNAIVQDRDGRFVSGLSADDFDLLEDGKPQSIQLFYLVTGPASVVARAKVPEGVRRSPDQTAHRLFTLYFDVEHMDLESFAHARRGAIAFLQENFRPGDVGGVVVGGVLANSRLTTDREALVAAVEAARPTSAQHDRSAVFRDWPRLESEFEALRIEAGDVRTLNDAVARNCQDRPEECTRSGLGEDIEHTLQRNARYYLDQERASSLRLIDSLSTATTAIGRMAGRKTLVLFTEGFLVEDLRGVLAQLAARAARFGVTIYAIDARGLSRSATGLSEAGEVAPQLALNTLDAYDDGPTILSVETGGFVVRNSSDFAHALKRVADDTSTYYVLGYSSGNPTLDGRFRKIEVEVNWKGMEVRARRGYLATPLPPPVRATPALERASEQALPAAAPPAPPPDAMTEATAPLARPFGTIAEMLVRPDFDVRIGRLRALDRRVNGAGESGGAVGRTTAEERGWDRCLEGDLEGAARELATAAADNDAAPWVHYALGLASLGLGRYRDASASLERVLRLEPDFEFAYVDLADSYLQVGDAGKAADVLGGACARFPRDTDIRNALGIALADQGDVDAAITAFQQAATLDPGDSLAFLNLGRAYELRYLTSRRADPARGAGAASEQDRLAAKTHYEKYLALGGPFAAAVRAELDALDQMK